MSVLITGGCGYIGSQLSYILSDNNIDHVIVDNLTTGFKNLKNPKAKLFKIDISEKKISKIIKEKNIKCVILGDFNFSSRVYELSREIL